MGEKHFIGEVAQKAIIEHEGKILFVKNIGNTKWDFPGGRLHTDETSAEGLAREVLEEVGLEVEIGLPMYVESVHGEHLKYPRCFIFFVATLKSSDLTIKMQVDEIGEVLWVAKNDANSVDTWEPCKSALEKFLNLKDN